MQVIMASRFHLVATHHTPQGNEMTPKQNLEQSKKNLAAWDKKHGKWNPDLHVYEKRKP